MSLGRLVIFIFIRLTFHVRVRHMLRRRETAALHVNTKSESTGLLMARIGFGITALASLVFAVWFLVAESESPGISFAVALIGMAFLVTFFGFSKIKENGITMDGKGAGLAAMIIAVLGVGYIIVFFGSWLMVATIWLVLHVPLVIGIVLSPTCER